MRSIFLPVLSLVLSGPAFADSSLVSENEKSLFEISAPHVVEFLGETQAVSQAEQIETALSLLEAERPIKMRYDVINEGGLLKVETSVEGSEKPTL